MADEVKLPTMTTVVSSNVDAVGHDGADLFVRFKSGGTYRYAGVPLQLYRDLKASKSAGKFMGAHIKGVFASVRVI